MSIKNITVPDLGDATEVEVIELLVSVGQAVEENDSLLVLESDKAAMEIPAPMKGVVKSIAVNLGDQVSTGGEMLALEVADVAEESVEESEEKSAENEAVAETGDQASEETQVIDEEEQEDKPAEISEEVVSKNDAGTKPSAQKQSKNTAVSMVIDVPDLGTEEEVEVIEIHVSAGDDIAIDDALITLESDKAAMEVPATQAGTVVSLMLKMGDKVKTGSPILEIKTQGVNEPAAEASPNKETPPEVDAAAKKADSAKAIKNEPKPQAPVSAPPQASSESAASESVYAGPAVRKLARELGVALSLVTGSGAKSRITKEDLNEYVKARLTASPVGSPGVAAATDLDFSQFGEIENVQRSKLHKITAINMHRNWASIPHVAQFNEADVTDLESFRAELKQESERKGIKLTFLPFLLKACAKTLREFPQFNVSLHSSGEYVIQKKYIHIGIAVATDAGLLVPVIRDVDEKTIWELAAETLELSDKAKKRRISPADMQGACFTISSLGAIGGTGFIPIINSPEVAILGVAKTETKPVYMDGEFVPRKMLPLTLSYDHRAVNGVDGGLFSSYLVKLLADIRHLLV